MTTRELRKAWLAVNLAIEEQIDTGIVPNKKRTRELALVYGSDISNVCHITWVVHNVINFGGFVKLLREPSEEDKKAMGL